MHNQKNIIADWNIKTAEMISLIFLLKLANSFHHNQGSLIETELISMITFRISANFTHKQFQWIEFEDINAKVWILQADLFRHIFIVLHPLFFSRTVHSQESRIFDYEAPLAAKNENMVTGSELAVKREWM